MNYRNFALSGVVGALMLAAPAFAESVPPQDLGDVLPGTTETASFDHKQKGNFLDQVFFTFLVGGGGSGQYTAQFNGGKFIGDVELKLLEGANQIGDFLLSNGEIFTFDALSGPQYTANISGTATGKNGGSYQLSITAPVAPVPEPEVWGSMAVGLGLAGFFATRRRKASRVA